MLAEWNGLCCKAQLDLNPGSLSFPGGSESKESACNEVDPGLILGREDSLEKGMATHIPVFLPGEFHGQRNLAGYGRWGRKELDMTE